MIEHQGIRDSLGRAAVLADEIFLEASPARLSEKMDQMRNLLRDVVKVWIMEGWVEAP